MPSCSRVAPLLLLLAACTSKPEAKPDAAFSGPWMTPNEKHHLLEPCRNHVMAPARLLIRVSVDEQGEPLASDVTLVGGTVSSALLDCVRLRSLEQRYGAAQGKALVVGAFIDLVAAGNVP